MNLPQIWRVSLLCAIERPEILIANARIAADRRDMGSPCLSVSN